MLKPWFKVKIQVFNNSVPNNTTTTIIWQKLQELQKEIDRNIRIIEDFNMPYPVQDRWSEQNISVISGRPKEHNQ